MFRKVFILLALILSLNSCLKEEFGGLGIQVPSGEEKVSKENPFIILAVFKGGAGDNYGLKSGDIIVSVDGVNLIGKKQDYIVKSLLRGKVGSIVILKIHRNGSDLLYRIPRGNIILEE